MLGSQVRHVEVQSSNRESIVVLVSVGRLEATRVRERASIPQAASKIGNERERREHGLELLAHERRIVLDRTKPIEDIGFGLAQCTRDLVHVRSRTERESFVVVVIVAVGVFVVVVVVIVIMVLFKGAPLLLLLLLEEVGHEGGRRKEQKQHGDRGEDAKTRRCEDAKIGWPRSASSSVVRLVAAWRSRLCCGSHERPSPLLASSRLVVSEWLVSVASVFGECRESRSLGIVRPVASIVVFYLARSRVSERTVNHHGELWRVDEVRCSILRYASRATSVLGTVA